MKPIKIIEPNRGRGIMCNLLGHSWDKPYIREEIMDQFSGKPAKLRLCISCKQWVAHGNGSKEAGSSPPHSRFILFLHHFIGDIINLFR